MGMTNEQYRGVLQSILELLEECESTPAVERVKRVVRAMMNNVKAKKDET